MISTSQDAQKMNLHRVSHGGEGIMKRRYSRETVRENLELYSIILPAIIMIAIFSYVPLYGLLIAFQDYAPGNAIVSFSQQAGIRWVGFKHFFKFINGPYFYRIMRNTIWLSFLNIIFGFTIPVIFALLLNEVKLTRFKKFVQTASYLPYFISMVVVAGMVLSFININGVFSKLVEVFGGTAQSYNTDPRYFSRIYTFTNVWKSFGFNSILYLSAIAAVDTALYESAKLDGARRFQLMRYITIPSIKPTMAIMLILSVGSILSSNTDLILLLYSPANYERSDVIGTYIYRLGIEGGQFSYTTAIGLLAAVINFLMVFVANKASDKITGASLW